VTNLDLFQMINAQPAVPAWQLAAAIGIAQWLIYLVPTSMVIAWILGDRSTRRELLELLLAAAAALALAQLLAAVWPQPRPFMLHLGTQWLAHSPDPGLPSDHVTVFWSLGLAALGIRRLRRWGAALLATGLAVGWSRVFLGVHFPYDVLAALPVSLAGALFARALRRPLGPAYRWLLDRWDGLPRPRMLR
jgi:undecaprenyl-diphosphatase